MGISQLIAGLLVMGCTGASSAPDLVAAEGPHQVQVQLTGLACCGVPVRVGLYRSGDDWLQQDRVFKARLVLTQSAEADLTLYGLPPGRYAVAAYQDRNGNGRLDRWFWVFPREPVAFSQIEQWRLPPDFEQSGFEVPSPSAVRVAF